MLLATRKGESEGGMEGGREGGTERGHGGANLGEGRMWEGGRNGAKGMDVGKIGEGRVNLPKG